MEREAFADGAGSEAMPLLPARMVNEFAYCPRLAYFEWVDGVFADNADTVEGRFPHTPPVCSASWESIGVRCRERGSHRAPRFREKGACEAFVRAGL
jgi:hypothetical protein